MLKVREAKLSDLKAVEGKKDLLGGPSFSLSALEMFMMAPDFTVQVAGEAAVVLYHEGKGGKSRLLLLVGGAPPELLRAAEESARKVGSIKITLEADPNSVVIPALRTAGYVHKGEVANYFGKDRPAHFMEKLL